MATKKVTKKPYLIAVENISLVASVKELNIVNKAVQAQIEDMTKASKPVKNTPAENALNEVVKEEKKPALKKGDKRKSPKFIAHLRRLAKARKKSSQEKAPKAKAAKKPAPKAPKKAVPKTVKTGKKVA